jgi:hypothetical protein
VEEELAPLVQALARVGIAPWGTSLDNRPGFAQLQFRSSASAEDFLNLVAAHLRRDRRGPDGWPLDGGTPRENALYRRITGEARAHRWGYVAAVSDFRDRPGSPGVAVGRWATARADFEVRVTVNLPRTDIPLVAEVLSRAKVWSPGSGFDG